MSAPRNILDNLPYLCQKCKIWWKFVLVITKIILLVFETRCIPGHLIYPGKYPECIFLKFFPRSAKSRKSFKKFEPKWAISLLAKRIIPSKVNTWINTFLRFYVNNQMVEEKTFYCWHQYFKLNINGNSKYRSNNALPTRP